jgi:hypothetical protein
MFSTNGTADSQFKAWEGREIHTEYLLENLMSENYVEGLGIDGKIILPFLS